MITKEFIERNGAQLVKVTFMLPDSLWAESVCLVGDFNDWDRTTHMLSRNHRGEWWIDVELDAGRFYQFRYICDNDRWMNDSDADAYIRNNHGSGNSVVVTEQSFKRYDGEGF
ncbi:MAG: isoamylase early set domain-containing protein [Caldilineaceae bacterium]|nr:isoamylase early set domain-containing protein [Caldilineaceae bacterium]